ncbi:hypothetical protein CSPAE12_09648 [Colletotrichum incanum]|nr:hypothetical protein CSPAE12_09648 [Colletotrichum incanum]
MGEGPFEDEEPEMQWWKSLPLVPAIAVVRLRQHTCRSWKPVDLTNMLTRFPNMKELCYEPCGEWCGMQQHTNKLCNSRRSQPLMIDASYFVEARNGSWKWEDLTSLALTSRVLTDNADVADINDMLRDAAAAALKMPKLETLEMWNGREGIAMLFRYQKARDGQPALITVLERFELALGSTVTQAWDAVALRHRHGKVVVQSSTIDPGIIRCHGDAICQPGLSTEVIRPVSLRQILNEHELRAGLTS